jgi:hypothetical protein
MIVIESYFDILQGFADSFCIHPNPQTRQATVFYSLLSRRLPH